MHQEEFSRRTGVSAAVVRAIESGRRGEMSFANSLDAIGQSTGATYGRDGQWHFMGRKEPYEFQHYLDFTRERGALFKKYCLHALLLRVVQLFRSVSPHRWLGLFLCLMKTLEETAQRYEIKGRGKIIENTKPQWGIAQRAVLSVDEPPRMVCYFRCFKGVEISDLELEDDKMLLDLRPSFASEESELAQNIVSQREARAQFDKLKAAGVLTSGDDSTEPDNI